MIEDIIRNRRTVKPAKMNGKIIEDHFIETMLEMADWAPNHGRTEPWRFIVLDQQQAKQFCELHASAYKRVTSEEKFLSATYDKLLHQADLVSHLIIVYMLPGSNPKIPIVEEIAAVSAAVQNMLLYATAQNISSFWSTGGLTNHSEMKTVLQLPSNAVLSGLLYFGYSDEIASGKRQIPLSSKIRKTI